MIRVQETMLNNTNHLSTHLFQTTQCSLASVLAKGQCWQGCQKTSQFIRIVIKIIGTIILKDSLAIHIKSLVLH